MPNYALNVCICLINRYFINFEIYLLKNTLKAFNDFKNKQKKVCFFTCRSMHIMKVHSIYYTLRRNLNVKKISFLQNKRYKKKKKTLIFLSRAPTHHSFTFNLRSLYELKHKVRFSKTASGIFHFWCRFVFMKIYIFIQ